MDLSTLLIGNENYYFGVFWSGGCLPDSVFQGAKGHDVIEFDKVNADWQDMTRIPNVNLQDALKDTDFCFFLAFDVGGSHYLKKYQHTFKFLDNNARMMCNAFQYLEKYKVPFVFASSQMSSMSYSPYGVMKRVGELYTESLGGKIVKFWNVYGIENDMEKASRHYRLHRQGI